MLFQQPLGHRVILKRKILTKTKSGIIIPEKASKDGTMTVNVGEVVAIGPGVSIPGLEEGTLVTFGRYSPTIMDEAESELYNIKKLDSDYQMLIINDDDILCILLEEDEPADMKEEVKS